MTKQEILDRLSILPQGGITVKKIKGKNGKTYEYHFLQWRENGKQKSRALKEDEIAIVQSQLEERKRLERLPAFPDAEEKTPVDFNVQIRIGAALRSYVAPVKELKKRNGFKDITEYVYGNEYNKVFILYGLRRTGKTTLIKQVIAEMSDSDFDRAAFIQITPKDDLATLNKDLKKFVSEAKRYGVLYCVLRDKGKKGDNTPVDIIARAEDASKIQRIFDKFELASVDSKATVISETQKDVDEREEAKKEKPVKSKQDIIADEALKKPRQKGSYAQENPIAAKTEKSLPSEPYSNNVVTESEKGAVEQQGERPSVREKLNRFIAQSKQQKSEHYQPKHVKESSKRQSAQTKHKQPKRKKTRHKKSKSKER